MRIQPLVPARNCCILPSAPMAMIVAFREMDGGAALITLASGRIRATEYRVYRLLETSHAT